MYASPTPEIDKLFRENWAILMITKSKNLILILNSFVIYRYLIEVNNIPNMTSETKTKMLKIFKLNFFVSCTTALKSTLYNL